MDPNTFLVYLLNGEPLPVKHGFPLRVLGAGTYGMKNPKWLKRIELVVNAQEGFWEHQGWAPDGTVQTMSRIDRPAEDNVASGAIGFEGISFAGDRGVQKVELSLDGGGTWLPAELQPPLGPLTWVFWKQTSQLQPGTYRVLVRATDGASQTQSNRQTDTFPAGATGLHSIELHVEAKTKA
jgi:hypothetical protein